MNISWKVFVLTISLLFVGLLATRCGPGQLFGPKPTLTPTTTPTPTPIPTLTFEQAAEQAEELTLKLSGEAAIECGELLILSGVVSRLYVNECMINAIQTQKSFRGRVSQSAVDVGHEYWIAGTPNGEVYSVGFFWSDVNASVTEPDTQLCENPIILYLWDKYFLECGK